MTRLSDRLAAGAMPLLAVTVNVYVPAVAAAPVRWPAAVSANPAGRAPAVTENAGAGTTLVARVRSVE